jgi:predicted nucleic acid-binding protein
MPGRPSSHAPWLDLPLVVDTSAWVRAHHAPVREPWRQALRANRIRVAPAVRLEILFSARDGQDFDTLSERLSALRPAPLTASVIRMAEAAMRQLAHRSAGAQRIPTVDYLVAAAAQELGAAVLHYDRDYDTIAEVMEFESLWLAAPGSLP